MPDEILVPLVDPEKVETISLAQLKDPLLEIATQIESLGQTYDKMARQSLHQRGRDGHLRVNRANNRKPRRTFEEREEKLQVKTFKESGVICDFEEGIQRTLDSPVYESEDEVRVEESAVSAESLRRLRVGKGS